MQASMQELRATNSMKSFSAAKAYCDAYHAACMRKARAVSVSPSPPAAAPKADPPAQPTIAPTSRVFVRADSLDNPYPGLTQSPSAGEALGASIGYTNNNFVQTATKSGVQLSSSQNVTATGMVTYLLKDADFVPGSEYLRWVPSVWLYANGNWDNPRKTFGDNSVLRAGPRLAFDTISYPWINYFDLAPFYQTNFYGKQQAGGASASWSPVNYYYHLGGSNKLSAESIDWFWELRAEATNVRVTNAGLSNLWTGDYQWLGGAARIYLFPFSTRGGATWGPYLDDRLSLIATAQSYWDAVSHAGATLYSIALQYKLTCSVLPDVPSAPSSAPDHKTDCSGGKATLTLQYDDGVDKDLLQAQKKLQLKLNYAY
jgi:hypothetical protein